MNSDIKQVLKTYNRSMLENSFGGGYYLISWNKMPNIVDSTSQILSLYFNWSTNEA